MTPKPAPTITDALETGDDGAVHGFYAFIARRRAPVNLEDLAQLIRAVDEYDQGTP